ncbi:MAG: hypothetical protein JWQ95_1019 [Sphaerisporangium sp.]|nr:hypothetical protein [Sphaerisporangium sp.]
MPKVKKFVGTLTIGAALTGGMVGLGAVTTTSSAGATSTISVPNGGDYRDRDWSRHRNRNYNRHYARNWNRSLARSWARNWARHLNRSLSRSTNRQAQAINIRLIFPNQLGAPVSASATSTPQTTTTTPTTSTLKD